MEDLRELAARESNNPFLKVELWWDPKFDNTFIRIWDEVGYDEFKVESHNALEAFYHPYSYGAHKKLHSVRV